MDLWWRLRKLYGPDFGNTVQVSDSEVWIYVVYLLRATPGSDTKKGKGGASVLLLKVVSPLIRSNLRRGIIKGV